MTIWVLDWKSSTGVWDEMRTQGAIYFRIWNHFYATGDKCEQTAQKAGILRLDKETGMLDNPPIVEITDIFDRCDAFLALRQYYKLLIEPTLSEKKMERFYKHEGKRFPTITTILDLLNKPALVQWSANMTVEYIKEHLDEMVLPDQEEYHLKKAKTAYREMSKKAMDTGSIVHDAIHAYLSGAKPESIIGDNKKAETAFLAFLEWADKAKLKPIALEKVLVDPVNEIGGTVDFIGNIEI